MPRHVPTHTGSPLARRNIRRVISPWLPVFRPLARRRSLRGGAPAALSYLYRCPRWPLTPRARASLPFTSPPTNSPSGGTFLVWTRLFRPLGAGGAPLFRRRGAAPRGARLFCPRSGFFHPKVRFLQLFAGERGGDKRLHGKLRPATFRNEQRPQFKLYTQCANIA